MKYFRVRIGYGLDNFISIDQTELAMALRAQITGRVGLFKEGTVTGKNIISITPDYNRMEGYNRDYQLNGEDYERIGKEKLDEYRKFLEKTKNEVDLALGSSGQKLLD